MADDAPLQPGWEEYESAGGEKYYFHPETQETTWDRPVAQQQTRREPPVPPQRDASSSSSSSSSLAAAPSSQPPRPSPLQGNADGGRGSLLAGIRGFGKGALRKASRDNGAAAGGSGGGDRTGRSGRTMSVQEELGAVLERRRKASDTGSAIASASSNKNAGAGTGGGAGAGAGAGVEARLAALEKKMDILLKHFKLA